MRISTRLTSALGAAGLLLFGSYGLYAVEVERQDLKRAAEREGQILARGLQLAVENALREEVLHDVRGLITQYEAVDAEVDLVIYDPQGLVIASSTHSQAFEAGKEQVVRQARHTGDTVVAWEPPHAPDRLLLAAPVLMDGDELGAVVVARSLDGLYADLAATRRTIFLSVLLFALTAAAVVRILGGFYLDRPLKALLAAMRRVRAGDLSSGVSTDHDDEIAAVATEFNGMVAELRHARARLEQEAEARRQLQQAVQQADKLVTIGQLSAGLAHEIGSPLQVLHGRARSLVRKADDPDKVRRHAETLVSQTERIARIVEQLLRLARHRPPSVDAVDLARTVGGVADLLRLEARRRGIALEVEAPEALPPVQADADQVQQLVLNLVNNAMAATEAGGRVRLRLEPGRLPRPDGREVGCVRLVVEDDGQGIPEHVKDRLFEPFFTTRAEQGGTGLGLAVVRTIVNDHGGRIEVRSEPGAGSRFLVDLPQAEQAMEQPA